MRQFALINAVGESYELNDVKNFFHDPNGLGFLRTTEYLKFGNRYKILNDGFEQAAPTGFICFKDERLSPAYSKYAVFIKFLRKLPLTLIYKSDKIHKMEVIPESIGKTEISKPLGLDISIAFRALTFWYDEVEKSGTTSARILSDSTEESPMHIEISGPVTDPVWIHTVNGTQVATGKITGTIASGAVLHIRTDTDPYQIYKVQNGTKTDLYSSSDFSTKRFMYLKEGENIIACAGASAIKVTGRLLYETV